MGRHIRYIYHDYIQPNAFDVLPADFQVFISAQQPEQAPPPMQDYSLEFRIHGIKPYVIHLAKPFPAFELDYILVFQLAQRHGPHPHKRLLDGILLSFLS